MLARVLDSEWRRRRLLVLCYHGVSLDDEHEWNPELYISQDRLRERLAFLQRSRANVLRLDDAVVRLREGTLPPRSVVITFDDGGADFRLRALPVLADFGYPATVYLTTHYCDLPYPVWTSAGRYLLWKGRDAGWLRLSGICDDALDVAIGSAAERHEAWRALHRVIAPLSTRSKDLVLGQIAERLGIDYEAFRARRMFQIMTADEVRGLPADLVDVELHTHRHTTPVDEEKLAMEIRDNQRVITSLRDRVGRHFCYTSGMYDECMLPWLAEHGIVSATTCVPGLVDADTELLLMPRLVDTQVTPDVVFRAWFTGFASLLPQGRSGRPRREVPSDRRAPAVRAGVGAPGVRTARDLRERDEAGRR